MSFSTDDSAIKVQPGSELEKAVASAKSVSEIQQILFQAAQDQHLIQRDEFDPNGHNHFAFREVAPGTVAAARGVARVVRLNGVVHSLTGTDEADLNRQETEL